MSDYFVLAVCEDVKGVKFAAVCPAFTGAAVMKDCWVMVRVHDTDYPYPAKVLATALCSRDTMPMGDFFDAIAKIATPGATMLPMIVSAMHPIKVDWPDEAPQIPSEDEWEQMVTEAEDGEA